MSGRILLVDDIDVNLRLLEARLAAEYYEVVTALSGADALAICSREPVDLVLLDVMMPGMDGFEVCRRLKADPRTLHLPVVLITALDGAADRITGLEAGADDFLTKPVREIPLLSRVKSLMRLKQTSDELRRRAETATHLLNDFWPLDRDVQRHKTIGLLSGTGNDERKIGRVLPRDWRLRVPDAPEGILADASAGEIDIAIIDLCQTTFDGLRLASQLRANHATRRLPLLVIVPRGQDVLASRALDVGAGDYIQRPLDPHELLARVRTQIRRADYEALLLRSVDETIEMALTDPLTGLHNRRFMDTHLARSVEKAHSQRANFALILCDIDHFKRINDGFGHDAGDDVLKEFGRRLRDVVRTGDLICRFGGEEFAILMSDTDVGTAGQVADRIRRTVAETPFAIGGEALAVTVSAGLAVLGASEDAGDLLKRADAALYAAKRGGRNQVLVAAAA